MKFLKKLFSILSAENKKETQKEESTEINRIKTAKHEAAHGIVWYLFKNNWTVEKLTIERTNLPDERMNGALHISANFDVEKETSMERANEIFAIALAGMIGQNTQLLEQNPYFISLASNHTNVLDLFDVSGCQGDFEIAQKFLSNLSKSFNETEYNFTRFKVFDLVNLFQEHHPVQKIHLSLSNLLLEKGTLTKKELEDFFDMHNFQEYIEEENLDINFYNRHS